MKFKKTDVKNVRLTWQEVKSDGLTYEEAVADAERYHEKWEIAEVEVQE